MIRAVFFDIDGTLLSFTTHRVPASTWRAIEALHSKGIRTFIASGRRKADIDLVTLPPMDGYITFNGGVCIDHTGNRLCEKTINGDDIERLIEHQENSSTPFPCVIVRDDGMYLDRDSSVVIDFYRAVNVPPPHVLQWEEWKKMAREGAPQLLGFFSPADEEYLFSSVMKTSKAMRWTDVFADVVPLSSSKSDGIDLLCERYGIDKSQTMAIGDGGNDIDMLRYAAVGVAMGQASDEVKAAADYVTSNVDDDGVARALIHLGVLTEEEVFV